MEVKVRPLRDGDIVELHRWMRHPKVLWGTLQLPSLQIGWMRRWFREPRNTIALVGELPGKRGSGAVAGMVILRRLSGRQTHVAGAFIAVDPRYHGKGVGTELMEAALDLAERYWRPLRVELGVYPDNVAALRLYRRFGFQEEGRRVHFAIRDGTYVDELSMARLCHVPDLQEPTALSEARPTPHDGERGSRGIEEIEIRPPLPRDAPALVRFYSDPAVVRDSLLMPFPPPDEEKIAADLETIPKSPTHVFLALSRGKVCGEIRLEPGKGRLRHSGKLTLTVPPPESGLASALGVKMEAVARALLTAALGLADRWLLLHRVEVETYADQAWLFPLLAECGFRQEVRKRLAALRDGAFADRIVWGRLAVGS